MSGSVINSGPAWKQVSMRKGPEIPLEITNEQQGRKHRKHPEKPSLQEQARIREQKRRDKEYWKSVVNRNIDNIND